MKRKARLEDWSVVNIIDPFDPFTSNLETPRVLIGRVIGHGEFEDNSPITTSQIHSINLTERIVETRNTSYDLGKMDSSFKAFLKKAREVVVSYPTVEELEKL